MSYIEKIALPAIFVISLILFSSSLKYFFFQDDWFVLNWVRTQDFVSFFQFRTDIIYWRPLSMPLLFFALDKLFPLNPFAFHVVAVTFFAALIFVVYNLSRELFESRKVALLAVFFYATSPIHFISLSWFSTTSYILGPLFSMLSFLFFVKFVKRKAKLLYLISFILFLAAIASSEFALVVPALAAVYIYTSAEKSNYKYIVPYIFVNLIYLFFRFIAYPVPARGDYSLAFDDSLINNFMWYTLWAIGIPESFKSLIFPSLPQQSIKILAQFWQITLPALVLAPIVATKALSWANKNRRNFVFLSLWFSISLLPVIFLTGHSYPVYLSLAAFGAFSIMSHSLKNARLALSLVALVWIYLSWASINFTKHTHWIRNEQAISRAYVAAAKEKAPYVPPDSTFIFRPANLNFSRSHDFYIVEGEDTLRLSLSDQNAMRVVYNDNSLKSIFLTAQESPPKKQEGTMFEINPQE